MNIGDVLCVKKTLYYHYAIYVGDGYIIHLKSNNQERKQDGFSVQLTAVSDYVKGRLFKVLPKEKFRKSFEPLHIVQFAYGHLGTPGYNILTNNCAHFVCMCITGKRRFALLRMIYKRRFNARWCGHELKCLDSELIFR